MYFSVYSQKSYYNFVTCKLMPRIQNVSIGDLSNRIIEKRK